MPPPRKPLSALLSQILVAYTVELDCEFERRMLATRSRGVSLSLVIWLNMLRFVAAGPITVRTLARRALTPEPGVKHALGCLERWGVVSLQPGRRTGFASGRGIRADWPVELTASGETAVSIWPDLIPDIDARWLKRFGDQATRLRCALELIEHQIDLELPQGLTMALLKLPEFAARKSPAEEGLPLPVLLSRVLLAFALEFESESKAPISLCANAIRVLGDEPIPEAEISKRTGCSEETAGLGWQHKPFIIVESAKGSDASRQGTEEHAKSLVGELETEPVLRVFLKRDPARGRGKFVRLSEAGIKAQHQYFSLTRHIEEQWQNRFGSATQEIRESLTALLQSSELSEGLRPPHGTTRAGAQTPSLGRLNVGPAAIKRAHDLVSQTQAFVHDPAGNLPNYPLWDMNRGFGP